MVEWRRKLPPIRGLRRKRAGRLLHPRQRPSSSPHPPLSRGHTSQKRLRGWLNAMQVRQKRMQLLPALLECADLPDQRNRRSAHLYAPAPQTCLPTYYHHIALLSHRHLCLHPLSLSSPPLLLYHGKTYPRAHQISCFLRLLSLLLSSFTTLFYPDVSRNLHNQCIYSRRGNPLPAEPYPSLRQCHR